MHRRGSAPTKTKIDAFMRFTLGRHKKAPRKKTKIYRRSNHHPIFDDEEIRFDLVDPSDYVANGDIDLTLELFDQNAWADELICAGNISILRYMVEAGGVVETVSLKVPGKIARTRPLPENLPSSRPSWALASLRCTKVVIWRTWIQSVNKIPT